jgi:hypothetical protein
MVETETGPRMIMIDIETGSAEEIPGAVPGPGQIGWSPDGRYLQWASVDAGNRTIRDLTTGAERRFFEEIGGELIFAVFSLDSERLLTHDWGTGTLWSESVEGGDLRQGGKLEGIFPRPAWWGPDGSVIVVDVLGKTVTSVPFEGGEPTFLAELPFECVHEGLQGMDLTGRILACSVRDWESDVWVVEGFDPGVMEEDVGR